MEKSKIRPQVIKLLDDLELWHEQDAIQAAFDAGVAVLAAELKEKEFPVHENQEDKILYGELEIKWAIEERALAIIDETSGDENEQEDKEFDNSIDISAHQEKVFKHKVNVRDSIKPLAD